MAALSQNLTTLNEHAAARDLDREILERRRRLLGENDPSTCNAVGKLAFDLEQLGETGPELDELRAWLHDH